MSTETGTPVDQSNNEESLKMFMLYMICNSRKLYNEGQKHFQENKNFASIKHKCIPLVLVWIFSMLVPSKTFSDNFTRRTYCCICTAEQKSGITLNLLLICQPTTSVPRIWKQLASVRWDLWPTMHGYLMCWKKEMKKPMTDWQVYYINYSFLKKDSL